MPLSLLLYADLLDPVQGSEDMVERMKVEKRTLEQQLTNMKSNAAELELILQKSHSEKELINVNNILFNLRFIRAMVRQL